MTLKVKCSYVAEDEPFTLGEEYYIFYSDYRVVYIRDDNGRRLEYKIKGNQAVLMELLNGLNEDWDSHFTVCTSSEPEPDPEQEIKQEIHELLSKATTLIYENQDLCNIKLDDFITLVKLTEDTK